MTVKTALENVAAIQGKLDTLGISPVSNRALLALRAHILKDAAAETKDQAIIGRAGTAFPPADSNAPQPARDTARRELMQRLEAYAQTHPTIAAPESLEALKTHAADAMGNAIDIGGSEAIEAAYKAEMNYYAAKAASSAMAPGESQRVTQLAQAHSQWESSAHSREVTPAALKPHTDNLVKALSTFEVENNPAEKPGLTAPSPGGASRFEQANRKMLSDALQAYQLARDDRRRHSNDTKHNSQRIDTEVAAFARLDRVVDAATQGMTPGGEKTPEKIDDPLDARNKARADLHATRPQAQTKRAAAQLVYEQATENLATQLVGLEKGHTQEHPAAGAAAHDEAPRHSEAPHRIVAWEAAAKDPKLTQALAAFSNTRTPAEEEAAHLKLSPIVHDHLNAIKDENGGQLPKQMRNLADDLSRAERVLENEKVDNRRGLIYARNEKLWEIAKQLLTPSAEKSHRLHDGPTGPAVQCEGPSCE